MSSRTRLLMSRSATRPSSGLLFALTDVARICGCSTRTIYRVLGRGDLPAVRPGHRGPRRLFLERVPAVRLSRRDSRRFGLKWVPAAKAFAFVPTKTSGKQ